MHTPAHALGWTPLEGDHSKEWKERVGYNSRRMVDIIISAFKRLLGETLQAVKPEYIMIEVATKIVVYNKTRNIMGKVVW